MYYSVASTNPEGGEKYAMEPPGSVSSTPTSPAKAIIQAIAVLIQISGRHDESLSIAGLFLN
jgi:hypothetical protein